jgi:hypothetical protein
MPQTTIGLAINPNGAVGRAIGHIGTRPAVLNSNPAALTGDGAIQPWYAYRLGISSNHLNIHPLLLPNTARRLQIWHTWTATGGVTVSTPPTVRAFGLLPTAFDWEHPDVASLPLNGETPHQDTPALWPEINDEFIPLVNDAGNSTAFQLTSTNVMTCNGSAVGDFTYTDIPRHSGIPTCMDTQGCSLVFVTISIAAVYSATAYGKIMGRVFA